MAGAKHYRAFISYSHSDERWARWIHNRLETYRVPRHLVGQGSRRGPVPRKVGRIFRDRDELSAGGDLSASVRDALQASETLIVLCSPAAAASQWVNREIEVFRDLNPEGEIITAILEGEPDAERNGFPATRECYPAAILEPMRDGRETEPAGADFRRKGDGRRVALVKLVGGLLDLRLDQIIQRDLQRRQQRVTAVTVISVSLALIMGGLTFLATTARSEAERRKAEAEDLIEFMLEDLTDRLAPVGRLEVLDAVGAKVIDYYAAQPPNEMSPDSLGRRAQAFHLLGRIDEAQGNLESAYQHFQTAYAATQRILAVDPDEPARIYEHSQSAYWVGFFAWRQRELDVAEARFLEYRDLTGALVESDQDNLEYQAEAAYAYSNLGTLYLQQRRYEEAHRSVRSSLQLFQALLDAQPDSSQALYELADAWGWLASVSEFVDGREAAMAALRQQIAVYESAEALDSDWRMRRDAMLADYAVARLLILDETSSSPEDIAQAVQILEAGAMEADALVGHDPDNQLWRLISVRQRLRLTRALLLAERPEDARAAYLDATRFMAHPSWLAAEGASFESTRLYATLVEAKLFRALGDVESAREAVENLLSALRLADDWPTQIERGPYMFAVASNILAELLESNGEAADAQQVRRVLIDTLDASQDQLRLDTAAELERARALTETGYLTAE
ncbi:toll/interleukin-1 receptor domain-containing protein [Maricaulis sp.]|uniref:toll/interleukin-1 receptor domain-containing protein n=1 Tax=Maricaulis sp. TaxID=1486257 RepID=UPI0026301D02|nr:toll/interleukin-1 receptor domain-containing protein [Maricaulis sp.]